MKKPKKNVRQTDSNAMTSSTSQAPAANKNTAATTANPSSEDIDIEEFIASCQDWVNPDLAKESRLWRELSWLRSRKGRWVSTGRCDSWQILSAIFGINFRHTKRGMVWNGGHLGVATDRELSDCHSQLARLWAKRKCLEERRQQVQNELSQIWEKLCALEESEKQFCQRAIKALQARSPSFRAAVECRQKIEDEDEQQRRRELPEALVNEGDWPPPRRLGERLRQRLREELQQRIANDDEPEPDPELPGEVAEQ
jgi:hypothetical protein